MKLRNKKTGEMGDLIIDKAFLVVRTGTAWEHYSSLAELNEKWEDYEEPKEYWYINELGKVEKAPSDWLCDERDSRKSIGNYFETKEEAEKAVEKLKAWKRLKDKGFRFDGYDVADRVGDNDAICGQVYFKAGNYDREEIENDIYLLFGGEE